MSHPVEDALGHRFARPELLREALTHRSAASGGRRGRNAARTGSNERLEFLGDRVLSLLMTELLMERFPGEQEGGLGRRLGHLVSGPVLAEIAAEIRLGDAMAIAPGEARVGIGTRATVLADALEAVLGALYLDGGLDPARGFVRRAWESRVSEQAEPPKPVKTALQEWAQTKGGALPVYRLDDRTGPSHEPVFTVTVTVGPFSGTGTAGSKRAAEEAAAGALLAQVGRVQAGRA
ncbi:MAG: ribonuclease III [Proteobacteria bacterium]|nr:ribonuclease III [Pseudomonadota bacterium]